jgi:renalase
MEVVVIGAGLAGLICATQLRRQGFNPKVVEKSGGVGGRMATRRLQGTHIDHGAQYISPRGSDFAHFLSKLESLDLVKPWTDKIYDLSTDGLEAPLLDDIYPRYCCPDGMTAIAKHLATDLTVELKTRIINADYDIAAAQWRLTTDSNNLILADAIVSAIPAPQFLAIFGNALGELTDFVQAIAAVKFDANVTVMAGYGDDLIVPPEWKAIRCQNNRFLSWVSCDSSKHRLDFSNDLPNNLPKDLSKDSHSLPTFVFQSTAAFAEQYLEETNLEMLGKMLLSEVGEFLDPALSVPLWWKVHRWRYAIPQEVLGAACLATRLPLPLVCAGDWCAGNNIEAAYLSGMAAAATMAKLLR